VRFLIGVAAVVLLARPALADCDGPLGTRPIPLPIYATLPNEGSTFGFMPVFLRVCDGTGRTESILAPSVSWNEVIRWTGTVRYFDYPTDTRTIIFVASLSTRINSNVLFHWDDLPRENGKVTREFEARWERSVFYRFFGIGADTGEDAETSYTRLRGHGNARVGLNLGNRWNIGGTLAFHRDEVQELGIPGLPISRRVFPGVPGMHGSTTLWQLLDIRYDTRKNREYSARGVAFEVSAGFEEDLLGNSPPFARGTLFWRGLLPELSWLQAAARLDASFVSTSRAPFYDQSSLGGAFLLRGFTSDRFIDNNAWTVELEQRIRVLQLHLFGVTADVRVDPFVGVGQVFGGLSQTFSNPHFTTGVGFRAFVHPNVLGRVDLATGGEGLDVYVELGYPY
jgi:hypothetical protein